MNLLNVSVLEEGGGLCLRLGEKELPLPPDQARTVRSFGTRTILLGIRPEDVRIGSGISVNGMAGTVSAVESLGREELVHVLAGGSAISVFSKEASYREGDAVTIHIPMEAAHFFRNPP
jgi:multiple sugar transport system ATP-binding protein